MLDIALLVPFQSRPSGWVDPRTRAALGPSKLVAIRARDRFFDLLGKRFREDDPPAFGPPAPPLAHRSLTAVALATCLERAGLSWRVFDPGRLALSGWRRLLERLRSDEPRIIAISTTFVVDRFWIAALCSMARAALPRAKILLGGYYYASDTEGFLSLDADLYCVGEGERRVVEITEAIRDGRRLDAIEGLYLREGGALRYTGDVEPLRLHDLPSPDWSLCTRIEPAVDPVRQPLTFGVETQRGCIFKCEFCTFRTLAAPVLGSDERAARGILDAAAHGHGLVSIADGTATYPRDRWRRILERLVAAGGSRVPITGYARVSDLDDDVCALMAKAGVRHVFIGQESGDQRMLDRMRKGTRADRVGPAIAALGRHGIAANVSFIYGFPGETLASIEATRRMQLALNDGHEASPVVLTSRIAIFVAQDFSGASRRDALQGCDHAFGWGHLEVTPQRAAQEALRTYLALSKVPHAPANGFDVYDALPAFFWRTAGWNHQLAFFRWSKAIDRGIGVFVEEELEGVRPDGALLERLRDEVLAPWPRARRRDPLPRRVLARIQDRLAWSVGSEWAREAADGRVRSWTRLALGWEVGRGTGRVSWALSAALRGEFPQERKESFGGDGRASIREEAERLVRVGVATGKRKLARAS